jgi:hypothetical protein
MVGCFALLRLIGAPHQKCLGSLCQSQRFAERGALQGLRKQPAATARRVVNNVMESGLHGEQSEAQMDMGEFALTTPEVTKDQ